MENLKFWHVICTWFLFAVALLTVNAYKLQSPLLTAFATASLGVFLFLVPVCPKKFTEYWSEEKCQKFIRAVAVVEILSSFVSAFVVGANMT